MNDNYSDNVAGLKIGSYTEKQLIVLYQSWRNAVYEGSYMMGFVDFTKSDFAKMIMKDWPEGWVA